MFLVTKAVDAVQQAYPQGLKSINTHGVGFCGLILSALGFLTSAANIVIIVGAFHEIAKTTANLHYEIAGIITGAVLGIIGNALAYYGRPTTIPGK